MKLKLILLLLTIGFSSSFAADVSCNFGPETPVPACKNFNITSVTSSDEEITILGQPSNYIDSFTKFITFNEESVINFIPTKIFKYFPSLEHFIVSNSSLTTLVEDAFINCDNLTGISIWLNQVSHLPARFASSCYAVYSLNFMNNQIKTIDEKAFEGLESLSQIYLNQNEISCLPPLVFRNNLGLNWIDISMNKITALHPDTFKDLTQLYYISFMMNRITYIPNFELSHTGSASIGSLNFQLNDNPINAIDPQFTSTIFYSGRFSGHSIISIHFSPQDFNNQNITTCIDHNTYQNNPMLFQINSYNWVQNNVSMSHRTNCYSNWNEEMASNSLVTCGSVITPVTTSTVSPTTQTPSNGNCRFYLDWHDRYTCVIKGAEITLKSISGTHIEGFGNFDVTRVYFIDSQLRKVPEILFDTFTNLNFLSIANCGLSVINDQTFNKCGILEFLDASHNEIIHVQETSLRNCTKLKTIDLTGNPVNYLSSQLYVLDPSLDKIHLNRLDDLELA